MITQAENGEIKTSGVRRDEETVQPGIDPDRSRGFGQTSRETISQPIAVNRDDWTRGNFVDQRGQAILGGIVNRLITKTIDLIQESESRTAELKQHLEELKELSTQFKTEDSE